MAVSSPDSCFKGDRFCAPGFRFHPTDEELVVYYLKRKICRRKLRVNIIGVVDVYKWDPEELPGQSLLKSGDRQWFFFTPRNRKYPNGARSSRGTATGYWKATGKDRTIMYNSRAVGLKKTLVFYRGRAPNGERTDWVMHEYTMDEEELGKCQNVKDYYALYKLYKKSGAGPKNGEQYGAPFQEEDWADDDNEDAKNVTEPEPLAVQADNTTRVDDDILTGPIDLPLDDIEELFKGIADVTGVPLTQINSPASAHPQVNSEEEIQSTLVHTSARETLFPNQIVEFMPNSQPYNGHASFNSPTSVKSYDASEVTSAPINCDVAPLVFEKEDYIEIDDLLIPELDAPAIKKPAQHSNADEPDGLSEFDLLFHDVAMSFDMDSVSQGTAPNPSTNAFGNSASNQSDSQIQSYPHDQYQQQTGESHLNNNIDSSLINSDHFSGGLWPQEQMTGLLDQPQTTSGAFAPTSSGAISGSTNTPSIMSSQDYGGQNIDGTSSQFASALWAFMESIPSTPASACEGPLLNRTFVRMSSISRIRFAPKSTATSVSDNAVVVKKPSRSKGFLLLSILGALCAIVWVLIATMRVSGSWRSILS